MKKQNVKSGQSRRRVTFAYYAPRAGEVFVLGDFNNWDMQAHPMRKDSDGLWKKITYLQPGRYEYLFMVDGRWCCDPRNLNRCRNCFGSENNVVDVKPR
jgi:1,4-alpha-glucan branching enzyme